MSGKEKLNLSKEAASAFEAPELNEQSDRHEKENRDRAGYVKHPQVSAEFDLWEKEVLSHLIGGDQS